MRDPLSNSWNPSNPFFSQCRTVDQFRKKTCSARKKIWTLNKDGCWVIVGYSKNYLLRILWQLSSNQLSSQLQSISTSEKCPFLFRRKRFIILLFNVPPRTAYMTKNLEEFRGIWKQLWKKCCCFFFIQKRFILHHNNDPPHTAHLSENLEEFIGV